MRKKLFTIWMAISFALTAAMAMAADKMLLEKTGEDLFFNPALGGSRNELSCNSCHNQGRGLESVADNPGLVPAIRKCLLDKMGGSNKDGQVKMGALAAYVRDLSESLSPPENHPDLLLGFRPGDNKGRKYINKDQPES
jgi:cytochrome c peroxidase